MASIDAIGDDRGAARKPQKQDVHGWVIIDKPVGMTSTFAVSVVKRLFCAKRAGHAGTLDPLASGCLPSCCRAFWAPSPRCRRGSPR